MRIGFHTLGCKLNQCETEALAALMRSKGFSVLEVREKCDVYVINTCSVTSKSEQKARRLIRSCARENPLSLVVVTGCYAQLEREAIASLAPNLVVVKQDEKDRLLSALPGIGKGAAGGFSIESSKRALLEAVSSCSGRGGKFSFFTSDFSFHSRAFLKIQDGCDAGCAYCIVPLARGGAVSLDPEVVIESVAELEKKGFREIVLTGVNISAYNHAGLRFCGLVSGICSSLKKARIRLSSIEPDSIDERLLDILRHDAICPHFHVPVQSGSDRVLSMMKRRYNAERLEEAVAILKEAKPGCFLGCDVIVGFPGETDLDFSLTRKLIEELEFSAIHVFRFSARPGTEAFKMRETVCERIKGERAAELASLSERLFTSYASGFSGKESEAILLQNEAGMDSSVSEWKGITGNYLKVRIKDVPENGAKRGCLARIRIDRPDKLSDATFVAFL